MENKTEIEAAVSMLNMAIAQRKAMVKSLRSIAEQIIVIDIDQYDYRVQLDKGLEILADYYGVEIKKTPNYNDDNYERYHFNVDGIEYFELKEKEGAEEIMEEEVSQ